MSRSYKHTPCGGDIKSKFFKRYANRRLRRNKNYTDEYRNPILKGNNYKKTFCNYDICDYWSYCTFEDYYISSIKWWYIYRNKYEPFPDREEEYKKWRQYYKNK